MANEEERWWFYVRAIYRSFLMILSQRCSNIQRITRKILRNSLGGHQTLSDYITDKSRDFRSQRLFDWCREYCQWIEVYKVVFLLSFHNSSKNKYSPMYAAIFLCFCYCSWLLGRFVPRTRKNVHVLGCSQERRKWSPKDAHWVHNSEWTLCCYEKALFIHPMSVLCEIQHIYYYHKCIELFIYNYLYDPFIYNGYLYCTQRYFAIILKLR